MNKRARSRGVSLLEVLSAISLFSIVASGVAVLSVGSLRQTMQNRHGMAAAMLAQGQLENLRGLAYDDIQGGSMTNSVNGIVYQVATAVIDANPAPNMKNITVTVTWTGPGGAKSYAVQTIFTAVTG